MKKKIVLTIYALCLIPLTACAAQISSDTTAHNLVWESKLSRHVEFLSGSLCGGRATGTSGSNEAAFWIIRNFRKYGLLEFGGSYAKHIYPGGGEIGHNR